MALPISFVSIKLKIASFISIAADLVNSAELLSETISRTAINNE